MAASVIEALLLWRLKEKHSHKKIELVGEWRYFDVKLLYQINSSEQIVGATRRSESKDLDKLDLVRIIDLCVKHGIIKSKKLKDDLDKVRGLRNRLHIGGLGEVEKKYTKADLEFSFNVVNRVKNSVKS